MIKEQCIYVCGAYRGYCARAEYDREDDLFHGEVLGVRDVVTFECRKPGDVQQTFQDSVDDYLAFCAERGESPEKPFSGRFLARIDPEVHRKLSGLAEIAGESLNQFIADALARIAEASAAPGVSSKPGASSRKAKTVAPGAKSRSKSRTGDRKSA